MKKIVFTMTGVICFLAISFAQSVPASPTEPSAPSAPEAPVKKEMSKEEKAAMKAKQDAEMNEALKGAGLTEAEITTAKDIMAEAGKKSNEIKKNEKLSDAEKDAARKVVSDEKNNKLKDLMGKDKYKAYTDIRKKQKEAAEAARPAGGK